MNFEPDLDFTFEDTSHLYRKASGETVRSVTQALGVSGIFDWTGVPVGVLQAAQERGKRVHSWTAVYDREGDADPLLVEQEEIGFCEGWRGFCDTYRPEMIKIEEPMLRRVAGIEVAGTPDRVLKIGSRIWIVDIKTGSTKHPGWALQTALYEMLYTRRSIVGNLGRMSVRVTRDGRFFPNVYEEICDGDAAIACLDPSSPESVLVVENWRRNHNL